MEKGLPERDSCNAAENRKLAYIDVNTRVLSDEEAEDECLTFARKYLEKKAWRQLLKLPVTIQCCNLASIKSAAQR